MIKVSWEDYWICPPSYAILTLSSAPNDRLHSLRPRHFLKSMPPWKRSRSRACRKHKQLTGPPFRVWSPSATALTPSKQGLGISVGAYNLGCFCGAIACIWIGNILGRRKTIFTGSAIMIVGAAIMASAGALPQFVVGRIITGYASSANPKLDKGG